MLISPASRMGSVIPSFVGVAFEFIRGVGGGTPIFVPEVFGKK
jgi:hypothetical protein